MDMATADDFRRIVQELPGVTEAPHFERVAFRARIIFASLAADGKSANLLMTPDQQALKCAVAPEVFVAVPNKWGQQGWTTMILAKATTADVQDALRLAHGNGSSKRS
jgi:hypothetical protein